MELNTRKAPKETWKPAKSLLPMLIEADESENCELEKLALFEKGLSKELRANDSIEKTVGKMVKMALAAEFGASFVKSKESQQMTEKIMQVMVCDTQLRRQALLIIDRFVKK